MPLAAAVSHRFGARSALRGLLALWTLSLALPSLAPGLWTLCAALLVYGATAGMSDVAMNALGVEVENRLGRSIMSGLHGMWSVGALIGSAAGTLAAHLGGDARLHHLLAAVVLTALGLAACQGVLDVRSAPDEEPPPRFTLPPRSALVIRGGRLLRGVRGGREPGLVGGLPEASSSARLPGSRRPPRRRSR